MLEEAANFVMLLGLPLGPVTHDLLFAAHVLDQALDGFGKIGHGDGGRSA